MILLMREASFGVGLNHAVSLELVELTKELVFEMDVVILKHFYLSGSSLLLPLRFVDVRFQKQVFLFQILSVEDL